MVKVWTFYNININLPSFNILSVHVSEDSTRVPPPECTDCPRSSRDWRGRRSGPGSGRSACSTCTPPPPWARVRLHTTRDTWHRSPVHVYGRAGGDGQLGAVGGELDAEDGLGSVLPTHVSSRGHTLVTCHHMCPHLVDPEHLLGPGVHDDPLASDGAHHHHLAVAGEGGRLDLDVITFQLAL